MKLAISFVEEGIMFRVGGTLFTCFLLIILLGQDITAEISHEKKVPEFNVLASTPFEIRMLIEFPEPEIREIEDGDGTYQTLRLPSAGWWIESGSPELPVVAKLIALPPQTSLSVSVESSEYTLIQDLHLYPCQDATPRDKGQEKTVINNAIYAQDTFLPEQIVEVGTPVMFRDIRMAPLMIHPVQYNPRTGEARMFHNISLTLTYQQDEGADQSHIQDSVRSEAFEDLYRSSIINYDQVTSDQEVQRGGYLFVTPEQYVEALQPLVDWKRQKGHPVDVITLSQISPNPTNNQIRDYIYYLYHNASTPLEYVVLVGDVYQLPTFYYDDEMETGREWDAADHPYAMLEGNDYFPDVFVGRLSVITENQLHTVVNKIVSYERDPYMGRTDWFQRALMICNYEGNSSARTTKLWIREKLMQKGYSNIPTSFTLSNYECNVGFIASVINTGVSFVNYRGVLDWGGWTSPESYSNINNLHNGFMLPVVTDMVCRAAAFFDESPAEAWLRAGTVMSPRGAVAAIGPSAINTKVYFNNVLDGGFYSGVFDDSLFTLGQALARAKMELYMQYPLNRGPGHAWNSVECYFYMYTLIGDPGMAMWTDVPQLFSVEHPPLLDVGSHFVSCTVRNSNQQPVEGAYVNLTRNGMILSGGFTRQDGSIDLPVSVGAGDFITITVTKPNFRPYQAIMVGRINSINLVVSGQEIDDDASGESSGDGDRMVNPGETIELSVTLRNTGTSKTASTVIGELTSDDPYVSILQSSVTFGTISPGDAVKGHEPYLMAVLPTCPDAHPLNLRLRITDGNDDEWTGPLEMTAEAPHFSLQTTEVEDSDQAQPNGLLDPGETIVLFITLANDGGKVGENVHAILRTDDPNISLTDSSATFGTIPVAGQGDNSQDPFELKAYLTAFTGHEVQLSLMFTSNTGMNHETTFSVSVGDPSSSDPVGPDAYGYYAYDNQDWRYYDKPTYDWIEIDPTYGGSGTIIYLYDVAKPDVPQGWIDYPQGDTRTILLPFTFQYYGTSYNQVSICSNGWLSMGSTWMTDFRNWAIPAVLSPTAIIAPFWDDLYMGNGHVVYFYDETEHRFIVEWSRVANDYNDAPETFQVILYDPEHYPTVTGDGEILFQYHTVDNIDYAWNFATVGIQSPDKNTGVEYTYTGLYTQGAAELVDGLAIKFTTGMQLTEAPYLNYYGLLLDDDGLGSSDGDGDGLIDAGEQIELTLRLINYGRETARNVTAILRSNDPNALLQDSVETFSNIAPGDTALSEEPYLISIAPDCENGHIIHFEVLTETSGAFCSQTNFNIQIVAPVITYETHLITDVQGDGDGRGESGETCELVLDLENEGQGQATGMWVQLWTEDEYITILDETADFPDVNPQMHSSNSSQPFRFSINYETPHHHAIFTLSIYSNGDHYTASRTFEAIIERADILLVDDDSGDTLELFFTEALEDQNWSSDYRDRERDGGLDAFLVDEYESIVWFTGNERDSTLTPEDQERLRTFLDNGGNLLLTGQDIGHDLVENGSEEDASFYSEYLHADFVRDIAGADILIGIPTEPLVGGVSQANILGIVYGGAGNQNFPSVIAPRDGASPLYTYSGTNEAAGIKYSNGYKLVYLAFGFEGIGSFIGEDHAETRTRLMQNITDWFHFGSEKGDLNGDGIINILDVIQAVHILLGSTDPTPREFWAADYNGDGQINVVDIIGIVNDILDGISVKSRGNELPGSR